MKKIKELWGEFETHSLQFQSRAYPGLFQRMIKFNDQVLYNLKDSLGRPNCAFLRQSNHVK